MDLYSRETVEHFMNPRLAGTLAGGGAAGEARSADPECPDHVRFEVRVADGRLVDVAQTTEGCVATVAAASFLARAVQGATVTDARAWTAARLREAMGGVPARHRFCLDVPVDALEGALEAAERA